MRHGDLTREQAIALVGKSLVEKLDGVECDYTNRCQTDGDTDVEFSASVDFVDEDGFDRVLIAYYYQDTDHMNEILVANGGDLGGLNWEIHGYDIQ
mgnify:FL=1